MRMLQVLHFALLVVRAKYLGSSFSHSLLFTGTVDAGFPFLCWRLPLFTKVNVFMLLSLTQPFFLPSLAA